MCIRDRSYEALLRGLKHTNVTVAELRKILRENKPDKPSLLNRLNVLDFESEKEHALSLIHI